MLARASSFARLQELVGPARVPADAATTNSGTTRGARSPTPGGLLGRRRGSLSSSSPINLGDGRPGSGGSHRSSSSRRRGGARPGSSGSSRSGRRPGSGGAARPLSRGSNRGGGGGGGGGDFIAKERRPLSQPSFVPGAGSRPPWWTATSTRTGGGSSTSSGRPLPTALLSRRVLPWGTSGSSRLFHQSRGPPGQTPQSVLCV